MKELIGVRFRQAGKVYYFSPGGNQLRRGDHVIVETVKGLEIGTVILPNTEKSDEEIPAPLKNIIRVATKDDIKKELKNREKEKEAYKICKEKIAKRGLEMKLIEAEYTFDNNKLLFYFTADGRIDFRELVKDLASVFRTRIELRQIGVRDETKMRGGIGICGRALCCHTFLSDFAPVSIKMAKEQSLSLNPTKISGVCGRLMCCLKNEEEAYEELNSRLPNVGSRVKTPEGLSGEVQSVRVLKQKVKVVVELENDEKEVRDYDVAELKFRRFTPKEKIQNKHDKELKKLEEMDKEDAKQEKERDSQGKNNNNNKKNNFKGKGKPRDGKPEFKKSNRPDKRERKPKKDE
ncbi:MAG: stage 0 sporulation family protein [Eubacterium sp.]|nr:stage 0 sporulation family protein [Eubacterium sp.]